ncbi:MAG: hypothetical protein AAFQ80_14285 [Cyanobacteria bacterium J06621_8]
MARALYSFWGYGLLYFAFSDRNLVRAVINPQQNVSKVFQEHQ